ncbi:MAG: F0F1 ATP synthase subunit A [Ignavibacteriales bacterium]|nr:F0F1 ATP synthase subunit A [Ignavibacteriales bacterium]
MVDPTAAAVDTARHGAVSVVDTALAAVADSAAQHGEGFAFGHLLDHMKNSGELELPWGHVELPHGPSFQIGDLTIDLSMSKHVFFLLVAAVIVAAMAIYAARKNRKSVVPKGVGNLLEVFILFIRDEVAVPNMGPGGLRYLPFLLTLFFFILIMNLLGLIPYGATSTSNISVTGALAFIAFIMIQVAAIRAQGVTHYVAHLTGGVHWALWPIMIPVEILGLFTKPFALCMRLFANMNGGHIVLLALIGLILLFRSAVLAPLPVLFSVGVLMLELFVAFLQAYIFVMLTSLFMGFGMQTEHTEEHAEQSH